jgi:histidinol-phosphate aminotransferase
MGISDFISAHDDYAAVKPSYSHRSTTTLPPSELIRLPAYPPHPSWQSGSISLIDRLDSNQSPDDLPLALRQELAQMWAAAIESNRDPDGGHNRLKAVIASYVSEESAVGNPDISPVRLAWGMVPT